jgi:hypothetical protein
MQISATADFVLEAFESLGRRDLQDGALDARLVPGRSGAYVAVSAARGFFVLLDVEAETVVADRRLNAVRVLTAENFTIVDASSGVELRQRFAVVELQPGHEELLSAFALVIATLLVTLPATPTATEVLEFLDSLATLLTPRRTAEGNTVEGLWGELWMICSSSFPAMLAAAWHANSADRFDFSLPSVRVEVKTTTRGGRTHDFSLDQLATSVEKPTWIASLTVVPDSSGRTVLDLLNQLFPFLPGDLAARTSRIALATLSGDIESADDFAFSVVGEEPLLVYSAASIPRPSVSPGSGISRVRFRVNLDEVDPGARSMEELMAIISAPDS